MNKTSNTVPDYGNWLAVRMLVVVGCVGVVFLVASLFYLPLIAGAAVVFAGLAYFVYARYMFAPSGGNLQAKIRELVITQLGWNGKGKALDIGCGNGPLAIMLAKKLSEAQVTGIDYWGGRWEYSKSACENNAKIEGVADRVKFERASAEKLPFEDGCFDAVVSNLVFHEVSSAQNKQDLIKEALRVLKKGGKFSFQDMFIEKRMYGDMDELLSTIRSWGVENVKYVDTNQQEFIPASLKPRFIFGSIGILHGTK
ncbi:MAG: class I SAM-dependent methyltransferase [Candidatus Bathyarchaeota archaeon]|nr:class I SAM-dependent methyltransferase [Candidatus Bathyarchaeota archaeon]